MERASGEPGGVVLSDEGPKRPEAGRTRPYGEGIPGGNRNPVSGGHTGRPYARSESGDVPAPNATSPDA